MPNVLILSASPVFRAGIRSLLASDPDITVTIETSLESLQRSAGVSYIFLFSADEAIILDQLLSIEDKSNLKVLAVNRNETLIESISQSGFGTWGIISSSTSAEALRAAIRAIDEGLFVFSDKMFKTDIYLDHPNEKLEEPLTSREVMVLQQLANGLANKQIAQALGISENTVKFHIASIYSKFQVNNRMEAMIRGVQLGIVAL